MAFFTSFLYPIILYMSGILLNKARSIRWLYIRIPLVRVSNNEYLTPFYMVNQRERSYIYLSFKGVDAMKAQLKRGFTSPMTKPIARDGNISL